MITSDWHCHSRNSCDCKAGPVPTTMAETFAAMRAHGITDFGVTDHVHSRLQLPDLEASRREFDSLLPSPHEHFGVEVSCVSAWELAQIDAGGHDDAIYGIRSGGPAGCELAIGFTADDAARLGVEYVVGGTHWPLYVPMERDAVIRDYHRQNMFLACHPLVDIVAHPWWWMGHWQAEDGMYHAEPDGLFPIPGKGGNAVFGVAERMLEAVGIRDRELWRLLPRAAGSCKTAPA